MADPAYIGRAELVGFTRTDHYTRRLKEHWDGARAPMAGHPILPKAIALVRHGEPSYALAFHPEDEFLPMNSLELRTVDLYAKDGRYWFCAGRRTESGIEHDGAAIEAGSKRHQVLLSYYRLDRDAVGALHAELERAGFRVWRDVGIPRGLLPGQDWSSEIRDAMARSYAIVVCFSQGGLARPTSVVYSELRDAIDEHRKQRPGSIFLIPVRLDACDIPAVPIDGSRSLSSLHAIDLFPPHVRPANLQKLIDALERARDTHR